MTLFGGIMVGMTRQFNTQSAILAASRLDKKGSMTIKKPSRSSSNKHPYIYLQYHTHDFSDGETFARACNAPLVSCVRGQYVRYTVTLSGARFYNLLTSALPYMKKRDWLAQSMINAHKALDGLKQADGRTIPKTCPCCGQAWPAAGTDVHDEPLF